MLAVRARKIRSSDGPSVFFADLIGAAPEIHDAFNLMGVVICLCCECSRIAISKLLPGSGRAFRRSFMSRTLKRNKRASIPQHAQACDLRDWHAPTGVINHETDTS
jgi:hypothetical protein